MLSMFRTAFMLIVAICVVDAQLPVLGQAPQPPTFLTQASPQSSNQSPDQFGSASSPSLVPPTASNTLIAPPFVTQSADDQSALAAPFVSAPSMPSSLAPQFIAPIFTAPHPVTAAGNLTRYIIVLTKNATDEATIGGNFTAITAQILPPGVNAQQVIAPPQPNVPGSGSTQSTSSGATSGPSAPARGSAPSLPAMQAPRMFTGIIAYMTPEQMEQVRGSKYVSYVEEDGQVSLRSVTTAASGRMNTLDIGDPLMAAPLASNNIFNNAFSQANPFYSWGLDRIDQRTLPLDGVFSPINDGSAVTIYLIDTGCRTSHQEFGGRAKLVYTIFNNGKEDQHGHGTHTAAKAAGSNVGVARKAKIACLSVLDANGSGTYSDFLQAMQFVMDSASGPSVLSLSIGGTYSQSVNDMAVQLIASGVPTISAAGNSGSPNTCATNIYGVSPASAPGMIVASSMNATDYFSSFSNSGSCITVAAPGDSILSAWGGGDSQYAVASGTSMATPHLTGVAALYMQANPSSTPSQLRDSMMCSASNNLMYSVPTSTPNSLLYMKLDSCGSNSNPTANYSAPQTGRPTTSQTTPGSDSIPSMPRPSTPSAPSQGSSNSPSRGGPGRGGPPGPPGLPNRTQSNSTESETTLPLTRTDENSATSHSSSHSLIVVMLIASALLW